MPDPPSFQSTTLPSETPSIPTSRNLNLSPEVFSRSFLHGLGAAARSAARKSISELHSYENWGLVYMSIDSLPKQNMWY